MWFVRCLKLNEDKPVWHQWPVGCWRGNEWQVRSGRGAQVGLQDWWRGGNTLQPALCLTSLSSGKRKFMVKIRTNKTYRRLLLGLFFVALLLKLMLFTKVPVWERSYWSAWGGHVRRDVLSRPGRSKQMFGIRERLRSRFLSMPSL